MFCVFYSRYVCFSWGMVLGLYGFKFVWEGLWTCTVDLLSIHNTLIFYHYLSNLVLVLHILKLCKGTLLPGASTGISAG